MSIYYTDDLVTLHHGDALEVTDWLSADVLITDPPYGMAFQSSRTTEKRPIAGDRTTSARDAVLAAWGADRPWLMFGTWRVERPVSTRSVLIWNKQGAGPGMGDLSQQFGTSHEEIYLSGGWKKKSSRRGSVITTTESPSGLTAEIGHPTPKPIQLMELLVSVAPDGVIADPFAGSGSTLVAAARLGRRAIGVELEEKYCEVIAKRLSQGVLDFGEQA